LCLLTGADFFFSQWSIGAPFLHSPRFPRENAILSPHTQKMSLIWITKTSGFLALGPVSPEVLWSTYSLLSLLFPPNLLLVPMVPSNGLPDSASRPPYNFFFLLDKRPRSRCFALYLYFITNISSVPAAAHFPTFAYRLSFFVLDKPPSPVVMLSGPSCSPYLFLHLPSSPMPQHKNSPILLIKSFALFSSRGKQKHPLLRLAVQAANIFWSRSFVCLE